MKRVQKGHGAVLRELHIPGCCRISCPLRGIFLLYEKDCGGMSIDADAGVRVN